MREIHRMLKEKRISVIVNAQIKDIKGTTKAEKIIFRKAEDTDPEKELDEGVTDYFVKPDLIIAENVIGMPKADLGTIIDKKESSTLNHIGMDREGIPSSNIRFSLLFNDIASPILAAGSCTGYPSFLHKMRLRTTDVKYNIEQGFYAAMNMMDK